MAGIPNIDRDEIRKFEAQTSSWWDKRGEFKGLHDINPLRLAYIADHVPLAGAQVIDVGCGGGILAEGLTRLGAEVTGIDAGEALLKAARAHAAAGELKIAYRLATAEELADASPGTYDVATCMELLEHVPDPPSIVRACGRLVKPGGAVFFATLNRTVKSFLLAIVAAEYILGIVKKGTHAYRRFVKPSELDRWAFAAGLRHQDLTGLYYNPVLKRKKLGGSPAVNYLMLFKKPE
ncbi:MAG: bifunctional 2-polyprenyl-6-hydroxyphenol methylase/3-demethylubiquinol 3-O-methyltransferase UbiG [Desulfobacterales bacterium]